MRKRATGLGQTLVEAGIPRLLMTCDEVAAVLCIGKSLAYQLAASGQIASVKIGKSRRVSVKALEDYIARLQDEQGLGRAS